jgi:hypothetical protein
MVTRLLQNFVIVRREAVEFSQESHVGRNRSRELESELDI